MEIVVVKCWLVVQQRQRNLGFSSLTYNIRKSDGLDSDAAQIRFDGGVWTMDLAVAYVAYILSSASKLLSQFTSGMVNS